MRIVRIPWRGNSTPGTEIRERFHPTQKPSSLAGWCFEKYGSSGDLVLDPFLGSGMSMVAAEATGRTVCGLEFDPEYVAAVLERLSLLGLKARLL